MDLDNKDTLKKLEKFIDDYMEQLPEMLKEHKDKWVVFGEQGKTGYFEDEEKAYEEGLKLYGIVSAKAMLLSLIK